jgi:polyferredoxin
MSSNKVNKSLSLANPHPQGMSTGAKTGIAIGLIGLLILFLAMAGIDMPSKPITLAISLIFIMLGTVIYSRALYLHHTEGIKNNGVWFKSITARGFLGWGTGIILTGFYVLLYWFPELLGQGSDGAANMGIIALFDPLSIALKGQAASQWFVYGTLYTIAILALGYKFILKYRHNKYQVIRTISVMFFQLGIAFLLPEILQSLNKPYYNFANMWPLNYYFFDGWHIKQLSTSGALGLFMLIFGMAMFLLISPILTYFYGKRWYCSWVCGCGGLAETAGDPFRQLSDKSMNAWKVERWMIHLVLVFVTIMTLAVLYSFFHGSQDTYWITKPAFVGIVAVIVLAIIGLLVLRPQYFKNMSRTAKYIALGLSGALVIYTIVMFTQEQKNLFLINSWQLRSVYGFLIGSAFSGVIGVGFYPIMGSRVWCRFGCPMAAILGLQQRFFSRFRITTNGGQCISCGNCSTYCEMGIDVRAYAQKGQNIVRASCVGCGICSAVCPRGVLRLENSAIDIKDRTSALKTIHISEDQVTLL